MRTRHQFICADSRSIPHVRDASVDLIVTSPPYPMIRMWDKVFSAMSDQAKAALRCKDGNKAFEAMHVELDKVWGELHRLLKPGGFACINVGDATRTLGKDFRLYSNHSRILSAFTGLGFDVLPAVLWRKQTNAPNKFMGSGMLPSGAYVTLEHEYVLVLRKGGKREFSSDAKKRGRKRCAYFWEERNQWFSDIWDFKGISQHLRDPGLRDRSAAFPFELPYRLISMYSIYGDTVLDPFAGMGTTMLAAITCGRNSVGVEIDKALASRSLKQAKPFLQTAKRVIDDRISRHMKFVKKRQAGGKAFKYRNRSHGFPVVTRQETELQLYQLEKIKAVNTGILEASYHPKAEMAAN